MLILMLPPPLGFVHLYQAVARVGRTMYGSAWVSVRCQDELKYQIDKNFTAIDPVMLSIAKACEAGTLTAAYEDRYRQPESLERDKWHAPHWRNYFSFGHIDLDLPLLDELGRADPRLQPVRCSRRLFIREDSLAAFAAGLPTPAAVGGGDRPKRGPKAKTLERVVEAMRRDIELGRTTKAELDGRTEKDLEAAYAASRDTVRKARKEVLSKLPEKTVG